MGATVEQEIAALSTCTSALLTLQNEDPVALGRVLKYLNDRFGPKGGATRNLVPDQAAKR